MTPYRFHPEAQLELRVAVSWYGERSPEAAAGFAYDVRAAVSDIRRRPAAWARWRGHPELRQRILRRFPFSLFYVVEDGVIVILAVAHHKRRPGYWTTRR